AAGRNLAERLHPLVLEQLFYDFGAGQSLARGCFELARAVALLARVLAHLLAKLGPFVEQGEAAGELLFPDGELSDQRGLGGEHVADMAARFPCARAVFPAATRRRIRDSSTRTACREHNRQAWDGPPAFAARDTFIEREAMSLQT